MITETQLKRYAEVLLWGLKTARNKPYKKGDIILLRFNLDAIRLAEIVESRLLEMGMNPVRRLNPTPKMEKNFFQLANVKHGLMISRSKRWLISTIATI